MKFPVEQGSEDQDDGNKSPAAHNPPNHLLISESNADGTRRANHASFWIHQPHFADCLIERDRLYFAGPEANHSSELSARNQLHSFDAKSCGQYTVKRARRSAALDVAQHGDADILFQYRVDCIADDKTYLPRTRCGKRVPVAIGRRELYSLSHDDHREFFSRGGPFSQLLTYRFNGERDFWEQDHVRASRESGMQRNPPRIPAHDFDDHHTAVGFRRCVQAVDCVRGDVQRGVEAERNFRGGQVVVDGLGHSNNWNSQTTEIARNGKRAVAADGDHGVHTQLPRVLATLQRIVMCDFLAAFIDHVVKGISAIGGAENRPAARQDARNRFHRKRYGAFGPNQPIKPVINSDDPPAVPQYRSPHRAANDGVQSRAVSTPVCNADGFDCLGHRSSVSGRLQGLKRERSFYTIREMGPLS